VPVCENVFAAIDPTCQRDVAGSTGRGGDVDRHQSAAPGDIHAARRRAPLGRFLPILLSFDTDSQ